MPEDPVDTGQLFVGPLTRNMPFDAGRPSTYCVDGAHLRGADARVGRVNLLGAAVPDGLPVGTYVVVRGTLHPRGLYDQLTPGEATCPEDPSPPMQWRSDWSADEGGHRTTRARLEAAPWIEAVEVRDAGPVLDVKVPPELTRGRRSAVEATSGPAVVTVTNPFDVPWRGVELRAHYESTTHGKPMPLYETRALDLEPRGSVTLELSAVITQELHGLAWTGALLDVHLRRGAPRALGSASYAD